MLPVALLFVGQASGLGSLVLLAWQLTPEAYGSLSAMLAVQNYSVVIGTGGLRTLVLRDVARSQDQVPLLWGAYWAWTGLFGLATVSGTYCLVSAGLFGAPQDSGLLAWLSLGSWFSIVSVTTLLDGLNRQHVGLAAMALGEVVFLLGVASQVIPLDLTSLGGGFALKWAIASILPASILGWIVRSIRFTGWTSQITSWLPSALPLMVTAVISNLPLAALTLVVRIFRGPAEAAVTGIGSQVASAFLVLAGVA